MTPAPPLPSPDPAPLLPSKPTSGAAITSLVFGILSLITIPGFLPFAIPSIICGHLGLRRTRKTEPEALQGRGMAIGGLVTGYIGLVIGVSALFFLVFVTRSYSDISEVLDESGRVSIEKVDPAEAEFVVILPEGHDPATPLPGAIWLHGYGWNPSELEIFEEEYQERADALGIAFVGISAPGKMDEGSYEWSEGTSGDFEYLLAVIDANREEVTLRWPDVVLFGFSQGAKVAGDVAMHHPERFAGALLFSPGGHRLRPHAPDAPLPESPSQRFFCFVGAEEAWGNVSLTRKYHEAFTELGAKSDLEEIEGMSEHSTPPDYDEKLSEWLATVLGLSPAASPE